MDIDLLMIKIGALKHVQDALAANLKAEIRADITALLDQSTVKTSPSDADIVALLDAHVASQNLVKATTGIPRYRSMGETNWIREEQLIAFGRSVLELSKKQWVS